MKPRMRTVTVPIRFSEEEHRILAAAARQAGLGLGPWLRSLGMREAAAATVYAAVAPTAPRGKP